MAGWVKINFFLRQIRTLQILHFPVLVLVSSATGAFAFPLVCKTPADCHPSVGAVHSNLGVCTGSLIAENLILTNAHCLPRELSLVGANCLKKIVFSFPKVGQFPFEEIDCESVVEFSNLNTEGTELKIDYAILKTKRIIQRPILKKNFDGLENEKNYALYKMNPKIKYGEFQKIECQSIHGTYLNPYFVSNKSPLILLKNCPTEKGNSGSPILSSDGQLLALFSGALDSHKNSIKDVAVGTHIACASKSETANPDCGQVINHKQHEALAKAMSSAVNKKATDELNNRMQARVDSLQESTPFRPRVYKFKEFVKHEIDVIQKFALEPECFLSLEKMKIFLKNEKTLLHGFQVQSGLDQNFRMSYKIDPIRFLARSRKNSDSVVEINYSIDLVSKNPGESAKERNLQIGLCVD